MNDVRSEVISFAGATGATLSARLDLPDGPPVAYAVFAHCFTCSKDVRAAIYVARALAERGIAVLRFDFTGLGGSGGDVANTNFSSNVGDLVAAADWLRRERRAPQLLIGHSLGGAAVIAAAPLVPEAVAVATINAPSNPEHVLHQLGDYRAEMEARGEVAVRLGGRPFRITRQFVDDVSTARLEPVLAHLGKALIVFHAPHDAMVDVANATHIFQAARHPKSFVSLDDADHLLSRRADAEYVGAVLAAWATRYLHAEPMPDASGTPADAPPAAAMLPPDDGIVRVAETLAGRFAQQVTVGPHRFLADEPRTVEGGTDTGPSPYALLLAALGACTAMTVRMYAELKKLPLRRVSVELRHSKIHAADCLDCSTREGRLDQLERIVRLEGDLDAAQRASLMAIADKCPVHRTLHSEMHVLTRESA